MARPRLAAPTSAEAELLLLQRQALLEEEVAKTKRALLTRFMQEKLKREEQSSRWGLHKVRTLWRSAQRKAKDQELRQDIEILSQTFTRVMDCKDGTIEENHAGAARLGKPGPAGHGTGHGAGARQERAGGLAELPERPGRHQKQGKGALGSTEGLAGMPGEVWGVTCVSPSAGRISSTAGCSWEPGWRGCGSRSRRHGGTTPRPRRRRRWSLRS
uniref:Dynein regulatory complex subunit 2 n=1 Tax=Serinus canaria TaxID=9135 RepID=A0A8C9NK04_SERCA